MRVDMRTGMHIRMCIGTCIDMRTDMCVHKQIDMCGNMCVEMCIEMWTGTCIGVYGEGYVRDYDALHGYMDGSHELAMCTLSHGRFACSVVPG